MLNESSRYWLSTYYVPGAYSHQVEGLLFEALAQIQAPFWSLHLYLQPSLIAAKC